MRAELLESLESGAALGRLQSQRHLGVGPRPLGVARQSGTLGQAGCVIEVIRGNSAPPVRYRAKDRRASVRFAARR